MRSRLFRQTLQIVLPLIILVSASFPGAAFAVTPELFVSVTAPRAAVPASQEMAVVRSRPVGLNLAALGEGVAAQAVPSIPLNFFEDVSLTALMNRIESRGKGRYTWFGSVPGDSMSEVILVVQDGVVAGNIVYKGRMYQVRPTASGTHEVREIDQAAFPAEADPIPVLTPLAAPDTAPIVMADSGAYIDVMVVYTPSARSAMGGAANIQALIQLGINETNQSYANSGITQRVNLVHSEEVSYTESASFETDLNRLTNPSDTYMDNVHTLRNTYHADLVSLWINNSASCGIAWLMNPVSPLFESYGFSVVHYGCATGYYSFGHEMGHNMAAQHDRYVVSPGSEPYYSYSYGYVDTAHKWRTVMAYNDACAAQGFNCTRIQFWSNPDVFYSGFPTGIISTDPNAADNRMTLNNTAFTVANFRQGCTYALTPSSASFGAAGGSGSFGVSTDTGCAWTASESLGWVGITSGTSGSGPGTVSYSVEANASASPRSGNINVADKSFVVNQDGLQPPTANFSAAPTSGTVPLQVTFTDSSTNATSWLWNFGDGGSSSLRNPTHTYQTVGNFTVILTAANAAGSDVATKTNYITTSACGNAKVRYGLPPSSYTPAADIASAYAGASSGDEIDIQAIEFPEVITFGLPKTVTLKGGYDCAYSATRIPDTVVNGGGSTTVMITAGTIIADQIVIR